MGKFLGVVAKRALRLAPARVRRAVIKTRNWLRTRSLVRRRIVLIKTRLPFLKNQLDVLRARQASDGATTLIHWNPVLEIPANMEDKSLTRGFVRVNEVIDALEKRKQAFESELSSLSAKLEKRQNKKREKK